MRGPGFAPRLAAPAAAALLALASLAAALPPSFASPVPAPSASGPPAAGLGPIGLAREGGAWWFSRGGGDRFLSRGACVVVPADDSARPGARRYDGLRGGKGLDAWAEETLAFLSSAGFNTIGCWSSPATWSRGMAYTAILDVRFEWGGKILDVFAPEFELAARKRADEVCAPRKGDPDLLGWFIANEQPWFGHQSGLGRAVSTLLDEHMALPASAPGKAAAVEVLRARYPGIAELNAAIGSTYEDWEEAAAARSFSGRGEAMDGLRNAFLARMADRFYGVVARAIRAADPGHLVLGDRFMQPTPRAAIEACGKHCDLVSLNYYGGYLKLDVACLRGYAEAAGKPLLISEFSWRATENSSGDRNTRGADVTVPTQADRARLFEGWAREVAALPFVVGYHWFQFFDESPEGRMFDGEDSDYGIVDVEGRPYPLLVAAMARMGADSEPIHAAGAAKALPAATYIESSLHVGSGPGGVLRDPRAFDAPSRGTGAYCWFDEPHGGRAAAREAAGKLLVDYETGSGWGAGFSLVPTGGSLRLGGSADLSGARGFELRLVAPKGLRFSIYLAESGASAPASPSFSGEAGADGECFATETFEGTGRVETYRVALGDFFLRLSYGNQAGNRTIDLQALRGLEIYLPGGQGKGTLELLSATAY